MRHTIADLKQMQSLPLDAKVQMTKARVRAWYEHFDGQVYVSFSGGKDSTVLKHVVDSMYDVKKNPLKKYQRETGRAPIVGTMADESRMRYKNWLLHGCNAFAARAPVSSPLSFWTEQDVLRYIVENGLEIASVYGEIRADGGGRLYLTGEERTGCMFCMFGAHLEKAPNRFQRMKKTHPRQWDYCMTDLGLKQVLDYLGVESE
jgi:3'-phosphoadenosine 5'-phosphosulfate sulfotransferase (PAPS reductase)/FAD synthetase